MVKESKKVVTKYVGEGTISPTVQPSLNVGFCQMLPNAAVQLLPYAPTTKSLPSGLTVISSTK